MRLYEYWNTEEIKQVVADSHVDEFEFCIAAKKCYGVEIEPGTVKQKWCSTRYNQRTYHDRQERCSYPVTIGDVKP